METTKPKRRWFRYSLRTFFVVVTAICCWLGWQVNAARKQREAVAAIRQHGCVFEYDYQVGAELDTIRPEPDPHWLTKFAGMDLLHDVVYVYLPSPTNEDVRAILPHLANLPKLRSFAIQKGGGFRDDDFKYLSRSTNLEILSIGENKITGEGFKHLARLQRLRSLNFADNPVEDEGLKYLAELSNLQSLILWSTRVTAEGVQQLKQSLPDLGVDWSPE